MKPPLRLRPLRLVQACFVLLTWFAACLRTPAADDEFAQVQIEVKPVAGAVRMLSGAGGNIAVSFGQDGILMVDDQFEPLAPKILAALATLGPGRPRVILNTHWHGDHVGGNKVFGPTGSIVAHRNVRARMVSGRPEPDHTPPAPREALPILTFDQGISVHFNDEEIRVIHLPAAHTDGDSVIWFTGSNVVHTGDLLFNGMFPFIDLDSGGSIGGYIAALEELLRTLPPDVRVIPGHGPPGDRSAIERSLEMLRSTSRTVREAKAAGKSLTEIQKAGLGAQWSAWAWAFIPEQRFIETLYRGL